MIALVALQMRSLSQSKPISVFESSHCAIASSKRSSGHRTISIRSLSSGSEPGSSESSVAWYSQIRSSLNPGLV